MTREGIPSVGCPVCGLEITAQTYSEYRRHVIGCTQRPTPRSSEDCGLSDCGWCRCQCGDANCNHGGAK